MLYIVVFELWVEIFYLIYIYVVTSGVKGDSTSAAKWLYPIVSSLNIGFI